MEPQELLRQAEAIAQAAHARVRRADLESTVEEFERSEIRSLRSLASVYRMLQWPPQQ
jgi:hypothetical protein